MARLYLLRPGTGNARVASSFEVSTDDVKRLYSNTSVYASDTLPIIHSEYGPANQISDPQFTVIELCQGETAFGGFRQPGFNWLDVDPMVAYNALVEKADM